MVKAFTPTAQRALAADPVGAFHELNDLARHVLRVWDPLGAYKGKHRPNERRRRLAAGLCQRHSQSSCRQLESAILSKWQVMSTTRRAGRKRISQIRQNPQLLISGDPKFVNNGSGCIWNARMFKLPISVIVVPEIDAVTRVESHQYPEPARVAMAESRGIAKRPRRRC
jgi:hypothetical protein